MLKIEIKGLDQLRSRLGSVQRQIPFAAARALTQLAHGVRKETVDQLQAKLDRPKAYTTKQAVQVIPATKQTLTATVGVGVKVQAAAGGTPYAKAIGHLFTGGNRRWKKMEGMLRKIGALPAGMIAVPGDKCPLDSYGNIRKAALTEMFGVLQSSVRNLRVYRRNNTKTQKAVGYFVVRPGDRVSLHPGIWKRMETGKSSKPLPIIMFVRMGRWQKYINFDRIAVDHVARNGQAVFSASLNQALATAR